MAGQPYVPSFHFQDLEDHPSISDQWSQNSKIQEEKSDYEIVPSHEVFAASLDDSVDIRPRIWDGIAKAWTLLDTGSQCSVLKPSPSDVINPHILLETVDGSLLEWDVKNTPLTLLFQTQLIQSLEWTS